MNGWESVTKFTPVATTSLHPARTFFLHVRVFLDHKLRAKELLLEKQLEVVRETRTQWVNNREDDIANIGAKAEDTALRQKKPELLAHFEKTIQYRSQIADKGLATRKKNQESPSEPPTT